MYTFLGGILYNPVGHNQLKLVLKTSSSKEQWIIDFNTSYMNKKLFCL